MKKLVVLCLCLISSVFTIQAQNSLAIRGGVNFASQTASMDGISLNYNDLTRFSGTLAFRAGLGSNFAIQPELSYLQKGSSLEFMVFGETYTQQTNMNYLEIPILFVYQPVVKDNFDIGLFAGPSLGIGVASEIEINGETEEIDWSDDEFSRTDFSLAFGADAQFGVGSGKFVLDVRYVWGVSNIASDNAAEDIELTNSGIGVSVGYVFPFGGQ